MVQDCCGSKNKFQTDVYLKEIELHIESIVTILSSIIDIIEETYMTLNEIEKIHFNSEYDIHMSSKYYEESGVTSIWILLTISD